MSNVKQCDKPDCKAIDDGDKSCVIRPTVITLQRDSNPSTFGADLCNACYLNLINSIIAYFPNADKKLKEKTSEPTTGWQGDGDET